MDFNWKIFQNFAITFFAYGCHIEILPIYDELQIPTSKRIHKIVHRSIFMNLFFFLTIGLAGYFSTYETTATIVIQRDPLIGQTYDIFLTIGRIMIILVLCVAYPINIVPVKSIVVHKLYSKHHNTTTIQ